MPVKKRQIDIGFWMEGREPKTEDREPSIGERGIRITIELRNLQTGGTPFLFFINLKFYYASLF